MALFDGLNGIILTTDECQSEKEKERRGDKREFEERKKKERKGGERELKS